MKISISNKIKHVITHTKSINHSNINRNRKKERKAVIIFTLKHMYVIIIHKLVFGSDGIKQLQNYVEELAAHIANLHHPPAVSPTPASVPEFALPPDRT